MSMFYPLGSCPARMSGGVKFPGDTFGGRLKFSYQGPQITIYVGIGLAYGKFTGHNVPFACAYEKATIGPCADWEGFDAIVQGTIPEDVELRKLIDAQQFICETEPVVNGEQTPDPFGVNYWCDEQYSTEPSRFDNLTVVEYT